MFVAGIDAHATYSVIAIVSNTGQYRLVTPRAPGRWLGNRRFADSRTGCRGILTSAGGRISHHRDLGKL